MDLETLKMVVLTIWKPFLVLFCVVMVLAIIADWAYALRKRKEAPGE